MRTLNHPSTTRCLPTLGRRILRACATVLAVTALLVSCSHDDGPGNLPGDDPGTPVPVHFTAAIQSAATPAAAYNAASGADAPATRTAPGADASQTVWTATDRIAVFMVTAGGTIPADTLPAAHNVPYNIDPATGVMKQAVPQIYDPVTNSLKDGTIVPMYYPSTDDAVDFVAYWPYYRSIVNEVGTPYILQGGLRDQTTAEKQYEMDMLFSDNARGIRRSKDAVHLSFRHLLAKLRLDITLGEGLAGGEITKVTLGDMPISVMFDVRDGSIEGIGSPVSGFPITCLKLPSPADAAAHATFTALVPPQAQTVDAYRGRKITVTVDGTDYTASIPDADAYDGNTMYVYPVRVTPRGITLGTAAIAPWGTPVDHGSGEAEYVKKPVFGKMEISDIGLESANLITKVSSSDAQHPLTAYGVQLYASANAADVAKGSLKLANTKPAGGAITWKSGKLSRSTTYQARAWATTADGTFYGPTATFTTLGDDDLPLVEITVWPQLSPNVQGNGINTNITAKATERNAALPVEETGYIYIQSDNPDLSLTMETEGKKIDIRDINNSFSFSIIVAKKYLLIRAYARSGNEIVYSETKSALVLKQP